MLRVAHTWSVPGTPCEQGIKSMSPSGSGGEEQETHGNQVG